MNKAKQVDWRAVVGAPIVFVYGNEEYFASRAMRSLREQLKAHDASLEITEIEAADYSSNQIFDLTAPSLFGEPRLLVIRGADKMTDELIADALSYVENPPKDVVVVIRHNNSSVRGKKLIDALRLSSNALFVMCDKLKKENEKQAFVQAEFAAASRKIETVALRNLVEAFNEDIAELAAACAQLLQDSSETITEAIVEKYYGGRVETTSYKLADTCMLGQEGEALAILRHVLQTGADPVMILGALAGRVRQVAQFFGASSAAAASSGTPSWLADKIRRESTYWTEDGLVLAVRAVAETDSAVKGGSRDPVFALESLVRIICKRGLV